MIDLITLHKTELFRGDPSEIADGFLRGSVGLARLSRAGRDGVRARGGSRQVP